MKTPLKKRESKLEIFKRQKEDKSDRRIIDKGPKRAPGREVDRDQTMKVLQITWDVILSHLLRWRRKEAAGLTCVWKGRSRMRIKNFI